MALTLPFALSVADALLAYDACPRLPKCAPPFWPEVSEGRGRDKLLPGRPTARDLLVLGLSGAGIAMRPSVFAQMRPDGRAWMTERVVYIATQRGGTRRDRNGPGTPKPQRGAKQIEAFRDPEG